MLADPDLDEESLRFVERFILAFNAARLDEIIGTIHDIH
jgi:hypothetical protein